MNAWFTCFYFAVIFTMLFFCIIFTDYADEWFTRQNRHGCFHEMNKIVSLSFGWFFIQNTLNLLNFGVGIKRWVSVYFLLSRGVSQGCPPSPHLCILGVEILACMIPQDKEIQGIKYFNSEAEVTQFADDTSLLWSSYDSAKKVNEVVDSFGSASDPKKNHLGLNGRKNQSEHCVFSYHMMKGKIITRIF